MMLGVYLPSPHEQSFHAYLLHASPTNVVQLVLFRRHRVFEYEDWPQSKVELFP